jgi:hypothetical protein
VLVVAVVVGGGDVVGATVSVTVWVTVFGGWLTVTVFADCAPVVTVTVCVDGRRWVAAWFLAWAA